MKYTDLNKFQQTALSSYNEGEYKPFFSSQEEELVTDISQVGDLLFEHVMSELSDLEDCDSLDTAIRRMETAKGQLEEVIHALYVYGEKNE